jgi:hypothetical protein
LKPSKGSRKIKLRRWRKLFLAIITIGKLSQAELNELA